MYIQYKTTQCNKAHAYEGILQGMLFNRIRYCTTRTHMLYIQLCIQRTLLTTLPSLLILYKWTSIYTICTDSAKSINEKLPTADSKMKTKHKLCNKLQKDIMIRSCKYKTIYWKQVCFCQWQQWLK